jgi:hypothetical protein
MPGNARFSKSYPKILAVINADMQNESFYKAARRKLE